MDSVDKRKSASYSMGKQKREAHFVNDKKLLHVPGAGKYDIAAADKVKQPLWSMPGDERFKTRGPGGPGPGNYEHPVFTAIGPKYTTRIKHFHDP